LRLEGEYGNLDFASKFKSNVEEARGILTQDDNFFVGEKLRCLEGMALGDYQNGRTEEYE
jgi:hypothetical protein